MGYAFVLTLAACGGGGDSAAPDIPVTAITSGTTQPAGTPDTPIALAPVTLTGSVIVDQAVRNAVVCLDLNNNASCDAGEPVAAPTGVDGAYSLAYDPSAITASQVADASLIAAMVPGPLTDPATTIDAADPTVGLTAKPYVLRQVPGKSGQINPLTTLVAAGIKAGMTEPTARANAALQLHIVEASIDNYQDEPAFTQDSIVDGARLMAKVTASALEDGARLTVGDQSAAVEAAASDLRSLRYFDANNYSYSDFQLLAKAPGPGELSLLDERVGKANATALAPATLYNQAFLTSSGWTRCDASVALAVRAGSPNRSTFCNASLAVGYTVTASVADRSMADVVTEQQGAGSSNIINNGLSTAALLAGLGTERFPAGAAINTRTSMNLTQPIFINSISGDARPARETTLEETIAAHPSSGVVLAISAGSLSLGQGSAPQKNLRVAFTGATDPVSGTVQFYECDLDASLVVQSNCVATQTGTYEIATVNGQRVLRFAGHPPTIMDNIRMYAEVKNAPGVVAGNRVYAVRQVKPKVDANVSKVNRLNATAWVALKAKLGL